MESTKKTTNGNGNGKMKPKVCIVGPGVVGQATGKAFIAKGVEVAFLGGNPEKTKKLREEGFEAYGRDELMDDNYDFDITMFTVPTPTENGEVNLEPMKAAARDLGKRIKNLDKYHVVVVKSTVPPGTTEEIVIPLVEEYSGKKLGRDFGACMNPEYLREETALEDTINTWLVVIGEHDKKSGDLLESAYLGFDCPLYRVSIKEAEMQKYVHNLYNAAKISFFNEMREIAVHLGADAELMFKLVALSAEGMWNSKYGTRNKGPFSGACLPKDTKGFHTWAKKRGLNPTLLEAVIKVNDNLIEKTGAEKPSYESGYTL